MTAESTDPRLLAAFLRESLAIEGIHRDPTAGEISATDEFLSGPLSVEAVMKLQRVYAPGKPLRSRPGMDVRVGRYIAPAGHEGMAEDLLAVLAGSNEDPHATHVAFELLHPFIDGNGRTGRAVWAWLMLHGGQNPFALTFLHRFYYQTLERARA